MTFKLIHQRKGFSLVELLVVVGIVVAIAGVAVLSLSDRASETDLNNTVNQISVTLREAQSRSISQSEGTQWGVHFANTSAPTDPFYALFSSAPTNEKSHNRLPRGVAFSPTTLAQGAVKDVTFSQITGKPSEPLSLGLYLVSNPQTVLTVTVKPSGEIAVLTKPVLIAYLDDSSILVAGALTEAQENAQNALNSASWGIRFFNPSNAAPYAELFYNTYSPGTVTKRFDLLPGIGYDSATVPVDSTVDITFAETTGNPSAETTITMLLVSDPTVVSDVEVTNECISINKKCSALDI